jgi:hypothetical protein
MDIELSLLEKGTSLAYLQGFGFVTKHGGPAEAPRLARRRQSGVGGRCHGHSIRASPRSPLSVTPLIRAQSSPLACPGV